MPTIAVAFHNPHALLYQVATYNEQADHPLRYAGDAIAAQYAANVAAATLLVDPTGNASANAAQIKAQYQAVWGVNASAEDPNSGGYVFGLCIS
jgi:hypothetical protein